jgi:hypothetical protein
LTRTRLVRTLRFRDGYAADVDLGWDLVRRREQNSDEQTKIDGRLFRQIQSEHDVSLLLCLRNFVPAI